MKRPRREGGGGEVALMAVITKAMGAFLVLVVIMLPDYIYVVQNGKQGAGAQQMLAAASREVDQLKQALNDVNGPPKDLTATRQNLQDLDRKLAALKDEVASLSGKLGQADAEIRRLTAVDVAQSGQQDARAQNALDAAMLEARQLEQALNASDATPQDVAAMRQRLRDLERMLAALKDEIASLGDKLRQAVVAIARLRKENEGLKAQAEELEDQNAKLKAEAEELKSRPLAATVVTLSWSGCYGADIELYIEDKVGDKPAQPMDRTMTSAPQYPQDRATRFPQDLSASSGTAWWSLSDTNSDQRLTLWAKLLNPFYGTHSKPRFCKLQWTISTSKENKTSGSWEISDESPLRLLYVYDISAKSEISWGYLAKLSEAEDHALREAPFKQPCEGLLCLFDANASAPRPDAEIRPKFLEYVRSVYDADDVAGIIFDLMASGEVSVADGYRWLDLFPYVNSGKIEAPAPEDVAALRRALEQKRAPKLFVDALMKRVDANIERARVLAKMVGAIPAFPAPPAPAENPAAAHERLVALTRQSVKDGSLTQAQSDAILAAASHSSKPSDAEIDKQVDDARLPPALAELLKKLIKSGDFDITALPKTTPGPAPSSTPSNP